MLLSGHGVHTLSRGLQNCLRAHCVGVHNLSGVTKLPAQEHEQVTQSSAHGVHNLSEVTKLSAQEHERVTQLSAHGVHNLSGGYAIVCPLCSYRQRPLRGKKLYST